ncbi:hypothetical protein AB4Y72_18455 [Arthrobacter sp. YAF34]|uniref:hypothetical protein n=1 Tax=Arthrobacter sp. YAF34 TaxID=3233083 RepID=UPI003F8FD37D
MEDPTTIALHLTFFGTLGVAFIMFLGLFIVFAVTLVIAGIGRLAVVIVVALARVFSGRPAVTAKTAKTAKPVKTAKTAKPRRPARNPGKKEPALSPEWAAAVARADARAIARARAEAGPAFQVSVRNLPSPKAPARDITEVSALVASATEAAESSGAVPRAFKKPAMPAAKSLLDTGSLVSLHGGLQAAKVNQPTHDRKAG